MKLVGLSGVLSRVASVLFGSHLDQNGNLCHFFVDVSSLTILIYAEMAPVEKAPRLEELEAAGLYGISRRLNYGTGCVRVAIK